MTIVLTFYQPAERIMSNDRGMHWGRKARLTKVWRQFAWAAAKARRVHPQGPSYVRVTFPVDTNRRRDSDGPAPTVKAIVDGLVDAGIWPDDTPQWVETLGSRFDKNATEVIVELIPREQDAA